jgi:hypothetical protein
MGSALVGELVSVTALAGDCSWTSTVVCLGFVVAAANTSSPASPH